MTSYPSLYKEMHDHVKYKIPVHHYHAILLGLANVQNVIDWRNIVKTNTLLNSTLTFKQGSSYVIPYNQANQNSLYLEQRKALKNLRILAANLHFLTPYHFTLIRYLRLFDFMRNRIAHRSEAAMTQNGLVIHPDFTVLGSEMVTRVRFPIVLPYFQLELHRRGLLSQLDLEPLFS